MQAAIHSRANAGPHNTPARHCTPLQTGGSHPAIGDGSGKASRDPGLKPKTKEANPSIPITRLRLPNALSLHDSHDSHDSPRRDHSPPDCSSSAKRKRSSLSHKTVLVRNRREDRGQVHRWRATIELTSCIVLHLATAVSLLHIKLNGAARPTLNTTITPFPLPHLAS